MVRDKKSNVYETAKSGGDYAKFYQRYKDEHLPRLNRAAKSLEKVIAEHEAWIKNPALKLGQHAEAEYARRYVEVKWPKDIARNWAYKDIIDGIIGDRKSGKAN